MQTRLFLAPRFLSASVVIGLLLIGLETAARAQSASDAPCSELTKQLFGPDAGKCSTISQAPAATPQPTATETAPPKGPLYSIAGEIYTIDRDMTAYYYFQSNYGGTAKAKYEYRYGRDLWNDNAQLRIRIPIITKWSQTAPTLSGLGNIELGYSYAVSSKIFDHYLELRVSTPTAANNASSNDTELKGFYNLKWRTPGFNVSYSNEYDQTIIKPPGSTWTSYYEGKLTFPDAKVLPGLTFSTFYNYRVLFDSYGVFRDALGATIFGNLNDVALSLTDSWGLGGSSSLWHYKLEVNVTARL